jgi:hypothetical protein
MKNFERLISSKEELAKQLTWERCDCCPTMPRCQIEQRKKCLANTIKWLDEEES